MNVGISVSRVGGNAQTKAMKKVAGKLRLELAQYNALAAFAQFASDLDAASQRQLARGSRLVELLKQPQYSPLAMEDQVVLVYCGINGKLDSIAVADIRRFEAGLLEYMGSSASSVVKEIRDKKALDDALAARLDKAVEEFKLSFK